MVSSSSERTEAEGTDRNRTLNSFAILDTPEEGVFDEITALAADICHAPMAAITFTDSHRQWIRSRHGLAVSESPWEPTLCAATIAESSLMEVPDTLRHKDFCDHSMVTGDPNLRFYASAALLTAEGHAFGTLSVMDVAPRTLSTLQRRTLQVLAKQVVGQLELRRQARQLASAVTTRPAADDALRKQLRLLNGVLKHTDVCIYAKDVEGRFVTINPAVERATGIHDGLIGHTDHEFFDPDIAAEFRRNDELIMRTRQWQVFSEDLRHPDGTLHTYRSTKFPLIDDDGEVIGIGGVSTDVTELSAARAAHAAAEQRWRTLVEQLPTAVFVADEYGVLTYLNRDAAVLAGAPTPEHLVSSSVFDLAPESRRIHARRIFNEVVHSGKSVRTQRGVLRRTDGSEVAVEFNARAMQSTDARSVQVELRDVTAAAATEAALKLSAHTDPLTGLLNRRAWHARSASLIADANAHPMTLAMIDLDYFKNYNDTYGHIAGDALLQQVADVAGASLRETDVLVRWGGEEFLIALPHTTSTQAEAILTRIQRAIPAHQTCSIGYTSYLDREALSDTVNRADQALYAAKRCGRNRIVSL